MTLLGVPYQFRREQHVKPSRALERETHGSESSSQAIIMICLNSKGGAAMRTSVVPSLARLAAAILLCLIALWTPTTSAQSRPYCECRAHADCVGLYGNGYVCSTADCEPINGLIGMCQKRPCPPPRPFSGGCIQVITYATDPVTGQCCVYPNPCSAPAGWTLSYEGCPN